jgi:hypothetical protein
MSETTLELYNALIEAGIEKKRAGRVAELVISREEARHLATKSDIADLRADLRVITARLNLLSALSVGIFVTLIASYLVSLSF